MKSQLLNEEAAAAYSREAVVALSLLDSCVLAFSVCSLRLDFGFAGSLTSMNVSGSMCLKPRSFRMGLGLQLPKYTFFL